MTRSRGRGRRSDYALTPASVGPVGGAGNSGAAAPSPAARVVSIFAPGDPDPSKDAAWPAPGALPCEARSADGLLCTWPARHPARWGHLASNGEVVLQTWAAR